MIGLDTNRRSFSSRDWEIGEISGGLGEFFTELLDFEKRTFDARTPTDYNSLRRQGMQPSRIAKERSVAVFKP